MGQPQINFRPHRGVVLTEACVALALIALVLATVSLLLTRHARATDYFLNYRRVQLAAESCVERMRAGALRVADADFVDEAGVACEIHVVEVEDGWRPLRRVSVTAAVVGRNSRPVRYSLAAYVEPVESPAGGNP